MDAFENLIKCTYLTSVYPTEFHLLGWRLEPSWETPPKASARRWTLPSMLTLRTWTSSPYFTPGLLTTDCGSVYGPPPSSPNYYQSHLSNILTKSCFSVLRLIRRKQTLQDSRRGLFWAAPFPPTSWASPLFPSAAALCARALRGRGPGLSQRLLTVASRSVFTSQLKTRPCWGASPGLINLRHLHSSVKALRLHLNGVCMTIYPAMCLLIFLSLGLASCRNTRNICWNSELDTAKHNCHTKTIVITWDTAIKAKTHPHPASLFPCGVWSEG